MQLLLVMCEEKWARGLGVLYVARKGHVRQVPSGGMVVPATGIAGRRIMQ